MVVTGENHYNKSLLCGIRVEESLSPLSQHREPLQAPFPTENGLGADGARAKPPSSLLLLLAPALQARLSPGKPKT